MVHFSTAAITVTLYLVSALAAPIAQPAGELEDIHARSPLFRQKLSAGLKAVKGVFKKPPPPKFPPPRPVDPANPPVPEPLPTGPGSELYGIEHPAPPYTPKPANGERRYSVSEPLYAVRQRREEMYRRALIERVLDEMD
ncbi:hypothetical protein D9611_008273 [Ephemerocybe angulata]|uniref:Uncharacterized protein n=1 Tax=Ephemerocybe angulata TaxID=980116 RepID=A0A8H5BIU9_9AGAR|nr:hypothetical protein D9611_008273 [Tulosesus angulatus]